MVDIPDEAVRMMVREANRQGREGRKVRIQWIPPASGACDHRGGMFVEDITPQILEQIAQAHEECF